MSRKEKSRIINKIQITYTQEDYSKAISLNLPTLTYKYSPVSPHFPANWGIFFP